MFPLRLRFSFFLFDISDSLFFDELLRELGVDANTLLGFWIAEDDIKWFQHASS